MRYIKLHEFYNELQKTFGTINLEFVQDAFFSIGFIGKIQKKYNLTNEDALRHPLTLLASEALTEVGEGAYAEVMGQYGVDDFDVVDEEYLGEHEEWVDQIIETEFAVWREAQGQEILKSAF